ncbi:hydrogenase formation HypD protein [Ammonifex degensii KC4]|uniref:Hydrogenase formation HypD protein n=1 Tax=Ammonifex degensii (strain DSM 10501 / KC4) TaxID=429009 RepID=C9R9V6_AMMDK|nr:hydrogenase formation protein HypD [Ammonifex degensii]ACX53085.1 hydrogenase formation HypD protein [Ammonifex degensii KC4]
MQIWERLRDPATGRKLAGRVRELAARVCDRLGRRLVFMEVCGTHTMAISRSGIRSLLRDYLELRSGPGCPVCVTDQADIDRMIALARLEGVVVGTFGDMLRVPGSSSSLERERALGAQVKIFYSPAEAVAWAAANPSQQMVFLGVGFETTAPGVALSIKEAEQKGISNYSVYVSHKLIPPALKALLADPENRLDGFLLPGHVSTIIGRRAYLFLEEYGMPAVIAGFEPNEILDAVRELLEMLLEGKAEVRNAYSHVVREEGNLRAQKLLSEVFTVCDVPWRGFGCIPQSGLRLREELAAFDAARRFELPPVESRVPPGCACGEILKGKLTPKDCPLFARACHPTHPVGPCMVSSEGACAAYYRYEREV